MSTHRGYCVARYCAMNGMVKEYKKYDKKPDTYFKNITVTHPQTGRTANLDIGYEQFLGPEMFFNPEIFHHKYTKGIPQLVDEAILSCPIDTRRAMYKVRWVVVPATSTLQRLPACPSVCSYRTSCCPAETRCSRS